jgi:hypothetical protein
VTCRLEAATSGTFLATWQPVCDNKSTYFLDELSAGPLQGATMFRLFLRKKILSGDKTAGAPSRDEKAKRNRRVFARHAIDHKHLTLMNEQDILLVREISAKGFSAECSMRGFDRLTIGDVYDARVRYLGEIYDMQGRVAWKQDRFVGFEIVEAERSTLLFIKRLLRPIEIATSLQPVEASFINSLENGKSWYHGDEESDLYTWHDPETGGLTAWQLVVGESYVEWSLNDGLTSGTVVAVEGREVLLGANIPGMTHQRDDTLNLTKRQFAIDVIMALPFTVKEELLETLTTALLSDDGNSGRSGNQSLRRL